MSRTNGRWIALGVALAGYAIGELAWAPAGIGLTFVAAVMAFNAVRLLNLPVTRFVFGAALLLHGLAIARASDNWLFCLPPVIAALLASPNETLARRFGYHTAWGFHVSLAATVAVAAASWPLTWWHLALAPLALGLALMAFMLTADLRRMIARARRTKVAVGDVVADFSLPSRLGRGDVTLSSFRGRHVLLCLMRGDWCPCCQVMMRIIAKDAKRLAERDVQVIAVSSSGGVDADDMARLLGADYLLAIDEQCVIATQLGAVDEDVPEPGRSVSLPAMVLIDPAGRLVWVSTASDMTVHDPRSALRFLDASPVPSMSPAQ